MLSEFKRTSQENARIWFGRGSGGVWFGWFWFGRDLVRMVLVRTRFGSGFSSEPFLVRVRTIFGSGFFVRTKFAALPRMTVLGVLFFTASRFFLYIYKVCF